MSEDTVKGPEDAIVSEVINQLPQENILRNHKMLSRTIHGAGRCAQFMEDRETHLPAETRCSTEDRDKKLQGFCADVGDVEVVCDLCHSPPGKRKEPEGWKQLRVGFEGISFQTLQVLMTQVLQKHWEWQEDRRKNMWRGSVKRPTMYLASMDIETAFDVARPNPIATIVGDQDVHGWITAVFLHGMAGGLGRPYFPVLQDASVKGVLRLLGCGKMAMQILGNVEPELKKIKLGSTLTHAEAEIIKSAAFCGWTIIGFCLTRRRTWSR